MTTGRTFLPEWKSMFDGVRHRGIFRLFAEEYFREIPGRQRFDDSRTAHQAAARHVQTVLNPEIRAHQAAPDPDPLGLANWHDKRAGQAANDQQAAFGAIFLKGRKIVVERRKRA